MTRTTTSSITLAGVLGLSALVLVLSGCAGSLPSQAPQSGGTATESAGPSEPLEGDVLTISLKFMPMELTVPVGTTVRWVNGETIIHTITSGDWGDVNEATGLRGSQTEDGLFDWDLAPRGQSGDSFEYTFDTAGTYSYYCDIHLAMNGSITVE